MLVVILVAFGIRTSWFQTFLAQQATAYLSKELGTEISIDKVDIVFFDRIDLEGIYVEDKIKDTLLYSELIAVTINDFSLSESYLSIDEVNVNNTQANIIKYKNDTTLNFQHIIDYFASEEKDTTSSEFAVTVETIALNDISFRYRDENARPVNYGFNPSNIHITGLSGEFTGFGLEGSTIGATISNLQFAERSGLVLGGLSTKLTYSPTEIKLENLKLPLNNTLLLSKSFSLLTPNGASDFSDFVHAVEFKGDLHNSKVSMTDVARFVPSLRGMDTRISINNMDLSGPVFGMKLNNTDINLLDSTLIRGDFQIPNLDDPDSALFAESLTLFQTTVADVEKLKLTPFLGGEDYLDLPSSLDGAGLIQLKNGHFNGYMTDFVVDGDLTSGVGNVSSEYGLRFLMGTDSLYYYHCAQEGIEGKDVIVENLDLGALTDNNLLGLTSGYLSIKEGSHGLSMDDLSIDFDGRFDAIELNDYNYNNIIIKEGRFANNRFTGVIDIEDDNLALNYDGYVDLNDDMHFNFEVKIDSAKLAELTDQNKEIVDLFQSKIKVEISGTNLNELHGKLEINDLTYKEGEIDFAIDRLELSITRNEVADSVILRSDLLDLDLIGKFDFTDMWPAIQHQLARVANNVIDDVDITDTQNEFYDLNIHLKNVNPLMQFTGHDIYVAEDTYLESEYSLKDLKLKITLNSGLVSYDGMEFIDIDLRNYFDSIRANIQYQMGTVKISDSLQVDHAAMFSYLKNNEFSTNIGWDGSETLEPALFAFNTHLKPNQDIETEFRPSFFYLKDHRWEVSPDSKLLWNHDLVELSDFIIRNGDHSVSLKGKVSKDPKDWLYFQVHDFDLADLNGILGGSVTIGGVLNVEGGVADVYNNIRFMSISDVQEFIVDGELVGDIVVDNKWDKETNSVGIFGNLKREAKETFRFSGKYFTELEKDNINLDLIFDYTDISFLNAFSDPDLYKDISGILNGRLKVTGELESPRINGVLDVVTANVMVPMFNVDFGISGELNFSPSGIKADYMSVYDQEGNNALAKMEINHTQWADWNYDVTLDMQSDAVSDRFLVMDTYYKDGDFYYGKAYISGDVHIEGGVDLTEINVNAATETGTDLKLAMYGTGELEESSFIVFDTIVPLYKNTEAEDNAGAIESYGLVLHMNFDINKDTRTTIIFDPIYQDQIEVDQGEGEITLNMDEYGEMDMFGKYTILAGNYFMRVKNLVKKDFSLKSGSTVQWTKSPYDAFIDIDAEYLAENVSLEPILPPGVEDSGEKEDVVATLHMGNTLLNPAISFKITAPNANEIGKAAVKSIQADADHLNKQFFAILALNRFLPANGGSGGSNNAAYNVVENQINNILEKFDEGLGLDLEEDETRVDYQKQLGERVTIKTSLGVVSADEQHEGGIIGDVVVEYRLNDDGTFTVNFFNESNTGTDAEKGPFTQGAGLHYEETFNTAKEFRLLQGFLNIFRKKENDVILKKNRKNGKWRPVNDQEPPIDTGSGNGDTSGEDD